jgi:hypothetical protein
MTDARKSIPMQYKMGDETEIKETPIGWDGTPMRILDRLGLKSGYHIVDLIGRRFPDNVARDARPLNIVHNVAMDAKKVRNAEKPRAMKEEIEVRFGDIKRDYKKGDSPTHDAIVACARRKQGLHTLGK